MTDKALVAALRQSAEHKAVDHIEHLIEHGLDRELNRINALAFAAEHSLDPQKTIAAFLHAAQLGLFEMSWNVLCPCCGGVLDASDGKIHSWHPQRILLSHGRCFDADVDQTIQRIFRGPLPIEGSRS